MKEPGLRAVEAKGWENVATRMRNWPQIARNFAVAAYGLPEDHDDPEDRARVEELIGREVKKAEDNLRRARSDRDYAVGQAEVILRWASLFPWPVDVVPTVGQIRRDWEGAGA